MRAHAIAGVVRLEAGPVVLDLEMDCVGVDERRIEVWAARGQAPARDVEPASEARIRRQRGHHSVFGEARHIGQGRVGEGTGRGDRKLRRVCWPRSSD